MLRDEGGDALLEWASRGMSSAFVLLLVVAIIAAATAGDSGAGRAAAAAADPSDTLHFAGETGGAITAAAESDGRFYLAVHSRIVVLEAGAPEGSAPLGTSPASGARIDGLAVRNGLAVTTGADLRVLDVRTPDAIRELGRVSMGATSGGDVRWVGEEVWVDHRLGGILRVSVDNPSQPQLLGRWKPDIFTEFPDSETFVDSIVQLPNDRAALVLWMLDSGGRIQMAMLVVARAVHSGLPIVEGALQVECCAAEVAAVGNHLALARGSRRWLDFYDTPPGASPVKVGRLTIPQVGVPGVVQRLVSGGDRLWISLDESTWQVMIPKDEWYSLQRFNMPHNMSRTTAVASADRLLSGGTDLFWAGPEGYDGPAPDVGAGLLWDVEPAPEGVWATHGQYLSNLSIVHVTPAESGRGIHQRPTGVTGLEGRPPNMLRATGDRLHVAGEWAVTDYNSDDAGLLSETARHDAHPLTHDWTAMVSASEERVLYRVNQSQSPGGHVLVMRGPTPGLESSRPRMNVAPGRQNFAGAAIVGPHVWVMSNPPGAPSMLRAWHSEGRRITQPAHDGVRLTGTPFGLLDAVGPRLFIARGRTVSLLSVADLERPVEVARLEVPDTVIQAAVSDDRMWVAYGSQANSSRGKGPSGGLSLFQLSQSDEALFVDNVVLGGPPSDLSVDASGAWITVEGALQRYVVSARPSPTPPAPTPPAPTPANSPTPTKTATPLPQATRDATPVMSPDVFLPRVDGG